MSERLLKTNEAAAILASTEKTLRDWRCKGKGPSYVKLGAAVRYKESVIQEFIKAL